MFQSFKGAFLKELTSIFNSTYKLFFVAYLPLLCGIWISYILLDGVLKELPVAVVDNDKTTLSRKILSDIDATKTLVIYSMPSSCNIGVEQLKSSKVYSVIVIPKGFEEDVYKQKNPTLTAMLNTQYILVGKMVLSVLNDTIMQSAGAVELVQNLQTTKTLYAAKQSLGAIKLQVTPLFNSYQNYYLFLVSALFPSMWQIFIVLATLISFGSLLKNNQLQTNFKHHLVAKLLGQLTPYTLIFTLWGCLFCGVLYGGFGWNFQGDAGVLVLGLFCTTIAYEGVALLFLASGFDYARSLSLGAVYTAPAFAFLGVTFPSVSMNDFALFWREMLPITHYMQLQISQASYGFIAQNSLEYLLKIIIFWLLYIVVFYRFRQRVQQ